MSHTSTAIFAAATLGGVVMFASCGGISCPPEHCISQQGNPSGAGDAGFDRDAATDASEQASDASTPPDASDGSPTESRAPCKPGFSRQPGSDACTDLDECTIDHGQCDAHATCQQDATPGNPPACACDAGFVGDGKTCERGVATFSTGAKHVCAISTDGTLWCWGDNSRGQLGLGDALRNKNVWTPTQVDKHVDWTEISNGAWHSCGLRNGALYCWGKNNSGQLGLGDSGTDTDRNAPQAVTPTWKSWLRISAGTTATCGIRATGSSRFLYCWGSQGWGSATTPTGVSSDKDWDEVSVGAEHTCALRSGALYCWGVDHAGETGQNFGVGAGTKQVASPARVGDANDWTSVSAGYQSTCAVNKAHELHCWGWSKYTPLAASPGARVDLPERVGLWSDWAAVRMSLSGAPSCGTRGTGNVWCWGASATEAQVPLRIGSTLFDPPVTGDRFGCVTHAKRLSCWGDDDRGQLAAGGVLTVGTTKPQKVGSSTGWTEIAAGNGTTCGVESNDTYCWGALADGRAAQPQQVGTSTKLSHLSVGTSRAFGIDQQSLYSFSLANPAAAMPSLADATTSWTEVRTASEDSYACGLRAGALVCWGYGGNGALGLGDYNDRSAPTAVQGSWSRFALGGMHACALEYDKLSCWGNNDYGQLGLGASASSKSNSPVQLGATGWSEVALGWAHSCGIRSQQMYCWGDNEHAQLGLGVTFGRVNQSNPMLLAGHTAWKHVVAAYDQTCAIDSGDELYCWGDNTSAQLGLGDDRVGDVVDVPTAVSSSWGSIAVGKQHACGIKDDGTLWCWGSNASGQLGLGPAWSDTPLPVQWTQ